MSQIAPPSKQRDHLLLSVVIAVKNDMKALEESKQNFHNCAAPIIDTLDPLSVLSVMVSFLPSGITIMIVTKAW
jgi:hypothetical protein